MKTLREEMIKTSNFHNSIERIIVTSCIAVFIGFAWIALFIVISGTPFVTAQEVSTGTPQVKIFEPYIFENRNNLPVTLELNKENPTYLENVDRQRIIDIKI